MFDCLGIVSSQLLVTEYYIHTFIISCSVNDVDNAKFDLNKFVTDDWKWNFLKT